MDSKPAALRASGSLHNRSNLIDLLNSQKSELEEVPELKEDSTASFAYNYEGSKKFDFSILDELIEKMGGHLAEELKNLVNKVRGVLIRRREII